MKENQDYIAQIDGAERRYHRHPVKVELRADGDTQQYVGATIEGYAAKFNSAAELGWYNEIIMPGAFDDVLGDDVRCLFNHNPDKILARTASSTLTLSVDSIGLKYSYSTPDISYAIDLAKSIERGDVDQSSFAFIVKEYAWEYGENERPDLRKILKVERLYDVSPVTFPAYTDTTVAKRSFSKPEAPAPRRPISILKKSLQLKSLK